VLFATGCTTRTLTIGSEPGDAEVLLDEAPVGRTPVTVPFRYGGVHEILVLKEGHRPARVRYDSERFLFDTPGVDLFTDLGPWTAEDRQEIRVVLEPSDLRERYDRDRRGVLDALLLRAEVLRDRARSLQWSTPPHEPMLPAEEPAVERPEGEAERDGAPPPGPR